MKKSILIITQTVDKNDSNLGFFCGWLKEFSRQMDNVYVIANSKNQEFILKESLETRLLNRLEDIRITIEDSLTLFKEKTENV